MKVSLYYRTCIEIEVNTKTHKEAVQKAIEKSFTKDQHNTDALENMEFEEAAILDNDNNIIYSVER